MRGHVERMYPYTNIPMKRGDVLYSSIGRSTYFVGHIVIVGSDWMMKESIPGKPSGFSLTPEQFWHRHRRGDRITLLRARSGADEAAQWATNYVSCVKHYNLLNYDINTIASNYCSKFIIQAFYFGAHMKLFSFLTRLITPQQFKRSPHLEQIARIEKFI